MTVVVDASALALGVLGASNEDRSILTRLSSATCHAPHLVDAELGSVLRRQVLRGRLSDADAAALLEAAPLLIDHRHAMTGALAAAAWSLRHNVGYYDALYVALAQALSAPLLTADRRLSSAPRLPCVVELV